MILALAGGVGGAKLARGLSMQVPPDKLQIVVNTGDDFTHLGLKVSPDVDTVMYWLAGINDRERGWGLAGESWKFITALEMLGGPAWFKFGDRDLATHIERTRRIAKGESLSDVTQYLCERLGIRHHIAPMTDDPVQTIVHTNEGELEFQNYFVRRHCEPRVNWIEYRGADIAAPSSIFDAILSRDDLEAIIVCPSNPLLSIEPILAINGVRAKIVNQRSPIVAVSPIVGGEALKGPAAKILRELGRESSALEIARHYVDLIDGIVIDKIDAGLKLEIEDLGLNVAIANIVMKSDEDQAKLAQEIIHFVSDLAKCDA